MARIPLPSAVSAISAVLLGFGAASGVGHAANAPERLGKVHFKVECNAAAQKEFDVAMAYYHSFAWEQYKAPLERALRADPGCGMVEWLRALALLDNPFLWPGSLSAAKLAEGEALVEAARRAGLRSDRERAYVDALAAFYKDHDKLNHRTRAKAFEDALEQVVQRYPADTDAAVLHSLVLSANFDPADKKYTNQLRAAKILEPIFKAQPEHPGVAHYLIHSYDYPPIATHGVGAAQRYSKIAPDAPHAQHMPSHIFTRVGMWRESVESNRTSSKIDADRTPNSPHAYDYLVYAHLQLAQERAAQEVIRHALGVAKKPDHVVGGYAYAAMPARLALERSRWSEAAALPLEPGDVTIAWKKYPQAEAINAFARGVGAARSGDVRAAQAEVTRLQALRDAATALKIGYWVEQIDIQAEAVRGLAAFAEGRRDEGVALLRRVAEREDATEKHAISPGPLLPARELLADMLFEFGKLAEALREYEAVLVKEPNRYRATLGAAHAAERAGNSASAKQHFARLVELGADADTPRAELAEAKRMLGK